MNYKVKFREEAQRDLFKAYSWYEDQKKGLGDEFTSEVENTTEYLKTNPEAYQLKRKGFREIGLKKFPYVLIYRLTGTLVLIFAIFHTHLNPNKKPSA